MNTIRIFDFGGYRDRQPLAYRPIRDRLQGRIELAEGAADAHILIISHFKDLLLFGHKISEIKAAHPRLPVVMLSEEPFWDSIWMPDPLSAEQSVESSGGHIEIHVLNHHTSSIFHADRVPYFLLTDPRYIEHYRPLLQRNAGLTASDWHRHFMTAEHDAVFLGARRTGELLRPAFPNAQFWALSVFRSKFAESCIGSRVVREGRGWTEGPPRQELDDWHLDKIERFDMTCRYMAAFENTHQPDYVSEKMFDAFAMGAIPLYVATPCHNIHKLVGSAAWINFFECLDPVPSFDAMDPVGMEMCAAYAEIQDRLARLFDDQSLIEAEYDRLGSALFDELNRIAYRDR